MTRSVAIVTPTFPPYRGGIGKVAELDARQLAALGLDVHVFTPSASAGDEGGDRPPYAVHRLHPLIRYGNAAFVPGVSRLLGRYSAVLLHYPFFGGAEPLWAAKRLSGKGKLVVMYHMDVVGAGALRPAFALHTKFWMPAIVREAERVLVTSLDYVRRGNLSKMAAGEPHRFRELPPGVDVGRFSPGPKPAALLERHGLGADDRIAVFVGGLDKAHYFKGIPVLLRAFATRPLAGAKAVIVGDGGLRPSFEALAKELGVASRVTFAGAASEAELPSYYRLADVFAFPSVDRSEAFGIAALEAMSSGVPVVASDLPGVRTIVRDGVTGIRVQPRSSSALALALASLLGDDASRRRMGAAGRVMAISEFADHARLVRWEKLVAELGI